jgi:hypothetical protein
MLFSPRLPLPHLAALPCIGSLGFLHRHRPGRLGTARQVRARSRGGAQAGLPVTDIACHKISLLRETDGTRGCRSTIFADTVLSFLVQDLGLDLLVTASVHAPAPARNDGSMNTYEVGTRWLVLRVQMIVVVHNDLGLSSRLEFVQTHTCTPSRSTGFAPDTVLRIALRPHNRAVGDTTGAKEPVRSIRGYGLPDRQCPGSDTTAQREEGDG